MTSMVTIAWKEVRALLPTWVGGAAALGVAGSLADPQLAAVALLAYGLAAIALGALSMGHEYSSRTVPLLLAQPIARGRLLLIKSGVLTILLLTLAAMAWALLAHISFGATAVARVFVTRTTTPVIVLPLLAGLFMAPLLTMWCRSAMAGVVFSIAAVSVTWAVTVVWGAVHFGALQVSTSELTLFRLAIFWPAMTGLSAVAAVSGCWQFLHLQAIEGPGQEVHLPQWARRTSVLSDAVPAGRTHPVWELTKKELRLQQMTFTVAALYVLGWAGMAVLRHFAPQAVTLSVSSVTILFGLLIALLAGSLASAEERQIGTLEWQLLLPVAVWRQWAVKAAVAFLLALLLGTGMPALLQWIAPAVEPDLVKPALLVPVLVLVVTGLYVSSLSSSGVRALLVALPVLLGAAVFLRFVVEPISNVLLRSQSYESLTPRFAANAKWVWLVFWVQPSVAALVTVAFVAVVLRFAMANHRTSRHEGRVWRQACWIGASALLGAVLIQGASMLPIALLFHRVRGQQQGAVRPASQHAAPATLAALRAPQ